MKRFATTTMVTLICAAVVMVGAQNPPAAPTPAPEVKKLDYFAGNWKIEGDAKPGPMMGQGGKFISTEHNEWMSGGFFLLSHASATGAMGNSTSIAVYGYNTNEKTYTFHEFASNGEFIHANGTLSGDTWTWINEDKLNGQTVRFRYTVKMVSPTSYTSKLEGQMGGGEWATAFDAKATKTK